MADKDYVVRLENVIRQMLTPLKDIPFNRERKRVLTLNFHSVSAT